MAFCAVAYFESNQKQMSIVPRSWFNDRILYWPKDKNKRGFGTKTVNHQRVTGFKCMEQRY